MNTYNPNLLIICTQYTEWTVPIYQPFGIFWDQPERRKIKSISFEQISNDYEAEASSIPIPDILIFDEAINPIAYKKAQEIIQEIIATKESVYLVVHKKNLTPYKGWVKALAGDKWVSHQQKNSTEGPTVDMLKKLNPAYHQRKRAVYYQLLADYFSGRRMDDLEELQFQLLNSFDQEKYGELADSLIRQELQSEQMSQLLQQYVLLRDLIHALARTSDPRMIGRYKLEMARLFWGDGRGF
ncbi:hypothetical protein [Flavilitoribacter nigricans]|uniref:Uncharacterized protein n=1 Tax=Flavilitoribacter nigricans (strain ATCC 23147 / DSM 23189 / NBRC 102662 / NCIMB 1420 / SS-2) TaxID=1122177 RepID=A0A2D0NHC2_FLAN2|nr:hypothetical protein [Flavilitoribacter nigricans]PHN07786.1 hypothetical protein CRP01_04505 [Flavilitoribacter nigricans DSM 23189 = NBRC 102662]